MSINTSKRGSTQLQQYDVILAADASRIHRRTYPSLYSPPTPMKAAAVGAPAVAAARGAKHRFAPVSSALAMVTLLLFLLVERAGSAATVEANGTRQVEGAGEGQHRELYAEQGIGRRIGRRCWTSYDGVSRCQANVFFIGVSKAGETACTHRGSRLQSWAFP